MALALACPPEAFAERVGTWTELPADSSSAVSATVASEIGLGGGPNAYKLGAIYDFSLNGPLLLSVAGAVAVAGEGLGLHLAPGVRFLAPMEGLPWIPYGSAALAVDLLGENVRTDHTLGLGVKLGGGLQYFFSRELAVAPEVTLTAGVITGEGSSERSFAIDALVSLVYRLP